MSLSVEIIPATIADAVALAQIQKLAFKRLYDIYHDEGSPYLRGSGEIIQWLERTDWRVCKIYADGLLCGGASFFERKDMPGNYYLARIFILPEQQNKDIASTAVLLCEKTVANANLWTLDFPVDQKANRRCYEKAGYADTGERREQSGGAITLAFMEKKIPNFRSVKEHLENPNILQLMSLSEYGESIERAASRAQSYRENDALGVYGWVENGVICGICAFETRFDKLIITGIAVGENYRNRGIGRAMISELKKKYGMTIEAETDDDAVEFYRKSGFDTIAFEKYGVRRWTCNLPAQGITHRIIPLERNRWEGHVLPFHYKSNNYYEVEIKRSGEDFIVSFIKKPFDAPFEYTPEKDYDKLFQPHWTDIRAWGIIESERLIAAIETAAEEWRNRLRVTELWIDDNYRCQGIGTALMDIAMKRARDERRRAVMLETQSRNESAIAFYLVYGFSLIGFNACEYSNNDLERKEVRMEMGILLSYDD